MKPQWIARKTSRALLQQAFPPRANETHKGDYGRVLLICGAEGYTGAPVLAAQAALRAGSGLIYVAVPEKIYPIVAGKLDSPIVLPMPCDENGRLTVKALPKLLQLLERMDACLLGPGLGRSPELNQLVSGIISQCNVPLVLDADGLNAVAGHIDVLRGAACPVVITPHEGEFFRLSKSLEEDRVQGALEFAQKTGCVILRKGHRTVITDGKRIYLNTTGNPGMAVGGSGDVLAGILVSILGRGVPLLEATAAAAWIHGAAGDICAEQMGQYAMGPMDLTETLKQILP